MSFHFGMPKNHCPLSKINQNNYHITILFNLINYNEEEHPKHTLHDKILLTGYIA